MLKRFFFKLGACVLCLSAAAPQLKAEQHHSLEAGFVNFKLCLEKSKAGQQERSTLEALKKQMADTLAKTEKELTEIDKKLKDQDYMDGLSPSAEEELNQKFAKLSQEYSYTQNQFYQMLNQANMRMIQSLHDSVSAAAETIRTKRNLDFIINEDSAFAAAPSLDFTDEVIKEMDVRYDLRNNAQTASSEK